MRSLLLSVVLALGCSESHGAVDAAGLDAAGLDASPRDARVPQDAPRDDCPPIGPPTCVDDECCSERAAAVLEPGCRYVCPAGFVVDAICDPAAHCVSFDSPCSRHDECALAFDDCCGPCGLPSLDDYDPILASRAADHFASVCPDPGGTGCPDCAIFANPSLGARCDAGRCVGYDVRQLPLSACTSDSDCRVRTRDCCECGGAIDRASLIAVRVSGGDYSALVCDDLACPECEPIYPSDVEAFCAADGHCDLRDVP